MWSPSSLIFLVLLGVWAAYFLQYWIRRRDHLATARSVEQFSEAMRVLERRDTTPRTDLSEPAPRSWNLHPGPATTRPQVLVKRAVPSEPASPALTARLDRAADVGPGRVGPTERPAAPAPAARRAAPARVRPSRRVRALLMLVALVELVTIGALVPLGYLAWWALVPAVVALIASFAYVRAGVRAEQRLRAAGRRRAATSRAATVPAAPARRAAAVRTQAPAATAQVDPAAAGSVDTTDTAADRAAAPGEDVAEQPAVVPPAEPAPAAAAVSDEPEHIEYVHLVDEDDIPLTWEPVPVPRPTYTMKARAERPEVPPADVTPDAAPVELPAEEGMPERRVAGA